MPELTVVDHVVAAALVFLDPLLGVWGFRRMERHVREGVPNARADAYRWGMLLNWTFAIGLVTFLFASGRPAAALGLAPPEGLRLWVGAIVTLGAVALLYAQWRTVAGMDEEGLAGLRAQFTEYSELTPRTERESALFRASRARRGCARRSSAAAS